MDSSSSAPAQSMDSHEASSEYSVPLEILEEIFHHLPYGEVIGHCRLVCKQWKAVSDNESLWRERCRREGLLPRDVTKTPADWREFYELCKKRRNLIKNPRAEKQFDSWAIVVNGGEGWVIEGLHAPHPHPKVHLNFVTSYNLCLKSQSIDLEAEGYPPWFMDQCQPPIQITDWYAPRPYYTCEYRIRVQLLNKDKKCIDAFEPEKIFIEQRVGQEWKKMTHTFRNYGPGVRYVLFEHGGNDDIWCGGWYGVRLTDSSVEVCPPDFQ